MGGSEGRLGSRSAREPKDATEGFAGQLRCASLADLIQLHCGNRTREAVSVRSDQRIGHLFFADGQIVHAVVGDRVGDAAVFELLEWTTGTFDRSSLAWPGIATVTSSWQQLLLTAAQHRDERQAGFPATSTSRLKAVRGTAESSVPPLLASDVFVERVSSTSVMPYASLRPTPIPEPRPRRRRIVVALLVAMLGAGLAFYAGQHGSTDVAAGASAQKSVLAPQPQPSVKDPSKDPSGSQPARDRPPLNTIQPSTPTGEVGATSLADPVPTPPPDAPRPTNSAAVSTALAGKIQASEAPHRRFSSPRRPAAVPPPQAPTRPSVEAPPSAKASEVPAPRAWDNDSPLPP